MLTAASNTTTQVSDKASVLFVDDEPRVLTSMRAMFRRHYSVFTAASAADAIDVLLERDIDVVVSDQRMPGMSGVELLEKIKADHPQVMRILLTGYADLEAIEASINKGEVFRYLVKPCPPTELKRVVELAVEAAQIEVPTSDVHVAEVSFRKEEYFPLLTDEVVQPTPIPVAANESAADVLVLSRDEKLHTAIAASADGAFQVHFAHFLDEALEIMSAQPVGVLVTDLAVNEHEVSLMTRELKQYVPELVTILVSNRSDANMLIDLINQGQVFRFLIKPIPQGQARIWLESARNKHVELRNAPETVLRHVVDEQPEDGPRVETVANTASVEQSEVWSSAARLDMDEEESALNAAKSYVGDATRDLQELRQRIQIGAKKVANRMTHSVVEESSKAFDNMRKSSAARSLTNQFGALRERYNQWKSQHG